MDKPIMIRMPGTNHCHAVSSPLHATPESSEPNSTRKITGWTIPKTSPSG